MNYANKEVKIRHDLIPTLEELRKMLDVSDIYTKFSIVFLAQTGMRPEDALNLKIGHIHRELNLGHVPLAIRFLPEKDRNKGIGERITFLGSEGCRNPEGVFRV
jgi:integrase